VTVVVTGANSFIGYFITEHLVKNDFRVFACYRKKNLKLKKLWKSSKNLFLIKLDITNPKNFKNLPLRTDSIVHVAGVSMKKNTKPADIVNCNINGTLNILQYAKKSKTKRLIFTSSLSVYGNAPDKIYDENTVFKNPNLYGASKIVAEKAILAEANCLTSVIIRLPGVVGPGAPKRAWLPCLQDKIKKNKAIKIFYPRKSFNNAINVQCLSKFVLQCIKKKRLNSAICLLGASTKLKIYNLTKTLIKLHNSKSKIKIIRSKTPSFIISNAAAEKIGYKPETMEKIIRSTIV
jgi:UDP-glucose 4-epimerase